MADKLKIKPIKNLSLVDEVEICITQFIKDNKLKIGDAIPKEMEFAEALGVSRTVVREALLRLRTIGIIESKKHKGMILTQPDIITNIEKVLETNLLGDQTLRDIFELRLILEMGMVDLLFARITTQDIIGLEKIVNTQAGNNTAIFSLEAEVAFHGKLYEISKNKTLKRFQELLLPVFQYVHTNILPNAENLSYDSEKFITHKDLLTHLKTGSPNSFRQAMRQHLEPHFNRILNQL